MPTSTRMARRFGLSRPTLSVCLITQNMAHFLPYTLGSVEDLADEIIVVDSFSTDGTANLLEQNPKVKFLQRQFGGHFGDQKNFAIEQATSDWVLVLDSDEILGDEMRAKIPKLVESKKYTHYKFARYWIHQGPPWDYVDTDLHYPDFQLRLFRNVPHFRYSQDKVVHTHFPREGRGPGKKMRRCHIFHYDFLLKDRQARMQKHRRYLQLEPHSQATSEMYLFEDFDFKSRRCKETMTSVELSRSALTGG